MRTVSDIIESLGGTSEVARAREVAAPTSTVDSWRSANSVPRWRRPGLLALAKRKRVALQDSDIPCRKGPSEPEDAPPVTAAAGQG